MHVGTYEILPAIDGEARILPTLGYEGTTEADWAPHRDLLDERGLLRVTFGGFLIRGGAEDRVVLVDAGLGHYPLFGNKLGGALLDSLAGYGVGPAEITDVVFTHLHIDHIGWAAEAGGTVFANAAYRCDQRDLDHWLSRPPEPPTAALPDDGTPPLSALAPLADRFTTWSVD